MSNEFFALASECGHPLWYRQVLMTIKASGDKTGGALGLLDFKTPAGQTPLHVHHHEDEGWYLLEGRITCTCGEESVTAEPGAFLWLPRDVPHRLRFETECHLLQLAIPAGLEVFHHRMGQPAPQLGLPPPGQVLATERLHRLVTPAPLPIAERSPTTISAEMACENYNGNPDDLIDGWIGLVVGDFSTGMIFDWMLSQTRVGALYERLPIPGVTPEGGSFSYIVQSPFVSINKPGEFRSCEIALDPKARTAEWTVDGKPFYRTEGIPVEIKSVTLGLIVCTLKPTGPNGSTSVHGQGAKGSWRLLKVTSS